MRQRLPRAPRAVRARLVDPLLGFFRAEVTSGVLLLVATVVALVLANSPWSATYSALWEMRLTLGPGALSVSEDLRHWINDALMTVFFLVVGLEIKRELVTGELRGLRAATLPVMAAAGGVVLPAGIFLIVVNRPEQQAGWGIPIATDIAFAVGVLALLGPRVSAGAKLFLLSIAIVDDVFAIGIIAVFYTNGVSTGWLVVGAAVVGMIVALQRKGVRSVAPYAVLGVCLWYVVHESGVHATIAGVVLAILTPARTFRGREVLEQVQRRLHPLSAFCIVPLFALANAGLDLRGGVLADAADSRVTWGIATALVIGKIMGIGVVTVLALRWRLCTLPGATEMREVWGVAALAGIGFTVSLFITDLAYDSADLLSQAKVGIFAGSLLGGLLGVVLLTWRGRGTPAPEPDVAARLHGVGRPALAATVEHRSEILGSDSSR